MTDKDNWLKGQNYQVNTKKKKERQDGTFLSEAQ